MPLTKEHVQKIFEHAARNEQAEMFSYVHDDAISMVVNPEAKSSFASGNYTNVHCADCLRIYCINLKRKDRF
ncbi:hypothetical protein I302_104536 [Kwoniella bestiolae CBS 10118]|uniref:Uncharacterized protein n=1 Tax=Kwoniella bestiolae CBS 10118 TaxID=1296100 RepID=A0AAJ8K838_9TREE